MRTQVVLTLFTAALATNLAYGYLDPGPSHLIIQFFVAMVAGSSFFFKRIFLYVKGRFSSKTTPPTAEKADGQKSKKGPRKAA